MSKADHFYYMNIALSEAKKSKEEVPVGAVIILDGEIIAKAHNQKEKNNDVTAHAEILAIKEASQKIGNWRLKNAILYVTLEPCPMCASAILFSRISKVIFGAFDMLYGAFGSAIDIKDTIKNSTQVMGGICEDNCSMLLTDFFEKKRVSKKELLEKLVSTYEVTDFIKNDPVQFPHRFKDKKQDAEISALVASCLAYGKREKIIESVGVIHDIMGNSPYEFCLKYNYQKDKKLFEKFSHRYTLGNDVALLFNSIHFAIKEFGSLENLFMKEFDKNDFKQSLIFFINKLSSYCPGEGDKKGLNYLLPNPKKGSACKRLNLFFKWMVRKGPVDLNLWGEIPADILLIPLDTHVSKLSRELHLVTRKSNDWKTAVEITENLKKYDSNDPVKYDFALFGIGVSGKSVKDFL